MKYKLLFLFLLCFSDGFAQNWYAQTFFIELTNVKSLEDLEQFSFSAVEGSRTTEHKLSIDASTLSIKFSYMTMGGENATLIIEKNDKKMVVMFGKYYPDVSRTTSQLQTKGKFKAGYFTSFDGVFYEVEQMHKDWWHISRGDNERISLYINPTIEEKRNASKTEALRRCELELSDLFDEYLASHQKWKTRSEVPDSLWKNYIIIGEMLYGAVAPPSIQSDSLITEYASLLRTFLSKTESFYFSFNRLKGRDFKVSDLNAQTRLYYCLGGDFRETIIVQQLTGSNVKLVDIRQLVGDSLSDCHYSMIPIGNGSSSKYILLSEPMSWLSSPVSGSLRLINFKSDSITLVQNAFDNEMELELDNYLERGDYVNVSLKDDHQILRIAFMDRDISAIGHPRTMEVLVYKWDGNQFFLVE